MLIREEDLKNEPTSVLTTSGSHKTLKLQMKDPRLSMIEFPEDPNIGIRGLRFNEGKIRYDLLEPYAIEKLAEVFTKGAEKYAPNNWLKGMEWSEITASLKRHLAAYEQGEDYDKETGLLHAAHVSWNAMALVSFYKYHPNLDDRTPSYLKPKKIGLDIDGVLADFVGHLTNVTGNQGHIPIHWNDPIIRDQFENVKKDPEFWSGIPPLMRRDDIPFEVHCYITARSIDKEVTQTWLDKNHFPKAKLYCVGNGESKVEIAKQTGLDIFVDDSYDNFVELNNAGVFTYLYTAPYNEKYQVGHRRINSLNQIA